MLLDTSLSLFSFDTHDDTNSSNTKMHNAMPKMVRGSSRRELRLLFYASKSS